MSRFDQRDEVERGARELAQRAHSELEPDAAERGISNAINASAMNWTAVLTADGSYTLAHPVHGETCHSRAGAWEESRERYARACRVRDRALEIAALAHNSGRRPVLRVLDVGTGLGLNLAAALEALDGIGVELEAVSLERDANVISAAIELYERMPEREKTALPSGLERWHAPVRDALRSALQLAASSNGARAPEHTPFARAVPIASGSGTLTLALGDARSTLPRASDDVRFDAVFLDPFSPAVDADLWERAFLAEIGRRMAPRSMLSTYTTSLRVRSALLAAGLRVGPGARVGTKAGGTIATPDLDVPPFDPRTARRLEKRAAAQPKPSAP